MAHHDHGHTPAAWTGSIIAFAGFCVGGAFMVADQPAGFWAGMVLILLGAVVGGAMKAMGLGKDEQAVRVTASVPAAPVTSAEDDAAATANA